MRWTGADGALNRCAVTNRIALALILMLAAFVAVDLLLGMGWLLFLARRFLALLDTMAFWR
jgi:hypothetical protein